LDVSDVFGLVGVALDLLKEEGEDPNTAERRRLFYQARGLKPLREGDRRLFISMTEIRKMGLR
jgi:hypothetical protein